MDGTLGLSQLFNVSVRTLAGEDDSKLALAGAVAVTDYTNDVIARVDENAMVNQNVDLVSSDPTVSVTADLNADFIEVGQMAAYNLNLEGFVNAISDGAESGNPADFLKQLVNPFGVNGKNAAGGVLLVTLADNEVVAEIQSDARVTSAGAITVDAETDFYSLAVVQTGAGSTDFGFSASVAVTDILSKVHASIHSGAIIVAGALHISADEILDRITIAGAFLLGEQVGIGTSVAVNTIVQDVAAYVGREETTNTGVVPTTSTLDIGGAIDIAARAGGDIFSLVMAGAVQGFRSNPPSGTDGAASTRANAKPIGAIALSIPVASNNIISSVAAYLDGQLAEADGVRIVGESNLHVQAVVVGAAFAVRTANVAPAGKLNLAGAGAVGVNTVSQNVAAFIKDSEVNSGGEVTVQVIDRSTTESDAGGVAIAASKNPQTRAALSFGVSVAINDISGNVAASVDNSVVRLAAGNLRVDAQSESRAKALSIAGGVSANFGAGQSGSFGGAGAHAENSIVRTIAAEVRTGSIVTVDAGSVTVTASDGSENHRRRRRCRHRGHRRRGRQHFRRRWHQHGLQ